MAKKSFTKQQLILLCFFLLVPAAWLAAASTGGSGVFARIGATLSEIPSHHLNILLLIGIAVFGGTVGGRLFQRFKIPQVVGYICLGILIGRTGFGLLDESTITTLLPFNYVALGLIGFTIGGELKKEVLLKRGKQFLLILLSEGLSTFLITSVLSGFILWFLFHNIALAVGLGLLFGAIASATAPAATVDVLWEYKTAGPLTNTILAIVAMDDGLALLLFVTASSIASSLLGSSTGGFLGSLAFLFYQVFGAILLGVLLGLLLSRLINHYKDKERTLTFAFGTILILIGLARTLDVDMILAAMVLGITLVNTVPKRSAEVFELLKDFAPPIFVIFFVLIGAKLDFANLSTIVIILALTFIAGRSIGKMFGARLGGRLAKAPETVARYLPLCLFSQAGVAIGLSILAGQKFNQTVAGINVGDTIVAVITATTFLVQIIGPSLVKAAVQKAGETGLNITKEDLIKSSTVGQVMDSEAPAIPQDAPLEQVLKTMSNYSYLYYPVIDRENNLIGTITIGNLKNTFAASQLHDLLIAYDLIEPAKIVASAEMPLEEAMEKMELEELNYLPVVQKDTKRLEGFIEKQMVNQLFARRIMEIRKQVDT